MSMKSLFLAGASLGLSLVASVSVATAAPSVVDKLTGPDGGWDYLTVDSSAGRAYVARSAGVSVFDLATKKVSTIASDLTRTHIALPINGGKELLVTVGSTGEAVIIDATTGLVRTRVKTGEKPDAAGFDPVSGLVWVMDNKGGGVALVNPTTGALDSKIAVDGALEFVVSNGQGKVFINVEDKNELVTVDVASRKVIAHTPLATCDGPSGLAYDAAHDVTVSVCSNKLAVIVSGKTSKVVGTVAIGAGPDAAVYDAKSQLVFVPAGREGKLYGVDAAKASVVSVTPTQVSARTANIDSATGLIYLPAAAFAPPATAGARPSAVPGSFNLVVVSTR